jgi:hypothetical protein
MAPIWQLWHTLDSIYPMPISRTLGRLATWLYDAQQLGLITKAERFALVEAEIASRQTAKG